MLKRAALLWVVLLQRCATKVCLTELPLHAQETDSILCKWTCHPGFYHAGTTCRECTSPSLGCPLGWSLQLCTPETDTICIPCPPLPPGHQYTNPGCNVTACDDGFFFQSTTSDCQMCPAGSYCANSAKMPCWGNCTIHHTGATNLLECSDPNDEMVFTTSFVVRLTSNSFTLMQCSLLDGLVTYGTFFGCNIALETQTLGSLKCQMSAATCISEVYREWLFRFMSNQTNRIQTRLSECLQSPGVRLSSLSIAKTTTRSISSSQRNEKLETPQQAW